MGDGLWVASGGSWKRKGRADRTPSAAFVLGVTRPLAGTTAGLDPAVTLTTYSGPNAGGTLTITTPTTYNNINFGTTRIVVNASDVIFNNCLFDFTGTAVIGATEGAIVDFRGGSTFTGRQMNRCEVRASSQWAPAISGVMGYGFLLNRCYIHNTSDGVGTYVPASRAGTALDVQILGTIITDLAFFAASTNGIVHPSDDHTHNDLIQHQGGTGLWVEGCDLQAFYSTTVGTGTPNSGNNTGGTNAAAAPYTQAAGQTLRFNFVEGGGDYSAGQTAEFLGGSISALMMNSVGRGSVVDGVFRNNWGGGGSYWLNAGDTGLSGNFGEISGNRLSRTMRPTTLGGSNRIAFGLVSTLTATVTGNIWTDNGTTIGRSNA